MEMILAVSTAAVAAMYMEPGGRHVGRTEFSDYRKLARAIQLAVFGGGRIIHLVHEMPSPNCSVFAQQSWRRPIQKLIRRENVAIATVCYLQALVFSSDIPAVVDILPDKLDAGLNCESRASLCHFFSSRCMYSLSFSSSRYESSRKWSSNISRWRTRFFANRLQASYKRIEGAMHNVGYSICSSTVANILKQHGIDPAPSRQRTISWPTFFKAHWNVFEGMVHRLSA
jgi:hypothetical protein